MASTFTAVTDTMNDLGISVWKVYGKGSTLLSYQNDTKLETDLSQQKLRRLLEQQTGDYVRVELYPNVKKSDSKTGGDFSKIIKMDVELSSLRAAPVAGSPVNDSSELRSMVKQLTEQNMKLQAELIETKYTNKIQELEKKIEGINDSDPTSKLIESLAPLLAAYLPTMLAPAAPAAKPKDINGLPVEELFFRLSKVDSEAFRVMSAIVNLAEQQPAIYFSFKPSLYQYE